jgi:6-pyruvoyltetrahydropterin/6-carboxytetrahydropterin synthase
MPLKRTSVKRSTKSNSGPKIPGPGVVYVTRQVHFNSAHRLYNKRYSLAWNQKQFGLCTNPHWHGHNYVLEVTVCGVPNPETGYVIDLGKLKDLLTKHILDLVDHRNLNTEVDFLKDIIPSTENLTIAFWNQLEPHITDGKLYRVRLFETPRNFADYLGPI